VLLPKPKITCKWTRWVTSVKRSDFFLSLSFFSLNRLEQQITRSDWSSDKNRSKTLQWEITCSLFAEWCHSWHCWKNFWATYCDSSSLKITGCIIHDTIICKYCGFDCLHLCSARTVRINEVIRKKDCSYPLRSCQSDRMFGLTLDWNWIFGLIFRLVGNSQLRPQIRPNCYCQFKNLCKLGLSLKFRLRTSLIFLFIKVIHWVMDNKVLSVSGHSKCHITDSFFVLIFMQLIELHMLWLRNSQS